MKSESKAIPFVLKNPQTEQYELSKEAEEFLASINTPLSVVAVAGLYRTGKSYLLNRVILNKSEGFCVGPTVNPCTKGLWIWNESIHTQDKKNVLVIDTEGLGALDQEVNHDMKIFCLAVLLSTTFIYNSVGNIDQNALQTLSLVLNLIGNIDQENKNSKPSFIWVVRDFSLQLVDDKGNAISPKQYLQIALNSDGTKESQKAQIRKNITNAFKDRDCFTLYKPLIDQCKLQKLDTIPLEELRPEFVSQTMALRKKIFNNLQEVKLLESKLTGKEYLAMVKRYLHAINEGKVPSIVDTWAFIKEAKAHQVSNELIDNYTEKIKIKIMSKFPMKFCLLDEMMSNIWAEMVEEFKRLTFEQSSLEDIEQFFSRIRNQVKNGNEEQMKIFLKNLLNKQFEVFSKKILSDYYQSIEELYSDIEKNFKQFLIQSYSDKVQGLNASISSFLQKKYIEAFKYFSVKFKLQIKKLTQNKEQEEESYKKQILILKKNSSDYQNQMKRTITEMDKKIIQTTRRYEQSQMELQREKSSNKGKGAQHKTKLQNLNETILSIQQKNTDLQTEKKKLEKDNFMMRKQHQKQLALLKQKGEYLIRQHEDQERRYQDLKKLLDQKIVIQEQEKKKFYTSSEERFQTMIQENQAKSDKIFELQQKIAEISEEYQQKIFKLQLKQGKILEQKEKMKENLIQDFSNKKESQIHQLNSLRDECRKYEEELEISLIQKSQLENRVKQISEELKHVKYNSQKQIAIHMQRIQFHEAEIKQLKTSSQETKKNYQSIIENMQSSNRNAEDKQNIKLKELSENYQTQIKNIDKELSEKLYQTKKELSHYKTTRQSIEIQLSLEKKKNQAKDKEFKESYAKLQALYKNLSNKHSNSEKDFHSINQEKQQYFASRIKQLETQIQEVKQKSFRQREQSVRISEEALAYLKEMSQREKANWEKRFQDQKQKNSKHVMDLKAEHQKKMIEQKQTLTEQNQMLEDKINQMQKYFNQTFQNMKYDYEISAQKMSNQYTQEKTQINKRNALLAQQIQLTKISMQNQIDEGKRNHQQAIESLKNELQTQICQLERKFQEEKTFLESKCQSLKKANKTVEQQNLILKNDIDKERALYKQKQSSHLKTINDLEQRYSHELLNHTKIIEQLNEAHNLQRKRLNTEIDSLKQIKNLLQDEKSNLAMSKDAIEAKLTSKITYLENKIKTNKADYDDLLNKFDLTSNFLNKKVQSLQKEKTDLKHKVENQFEQQISMKEDTYKKQIKDYNDRIYRLQTQNKSLRDKVILMEVKLASSNSNEYSSSQFEKLQEMKEQYMKREEQYRKLIDKLKRQNRKLKEQKELMEIANNIDKSKIIHSNINISKQFSDRDSIINGLNENSRHEASRSRMNFDHNKIMNTTNGFNQSRLSNVNALGQNKNTVNRKSSVSPMTMPKKYTNLNNMNGMQYRVRQQDFDGSRYY